MGLVVAISSSSRPQIPAPFAPCVELPHGNNEVRRCVPSAVVLRLLLNLDFRALDHSNADTLPLCVTCSCVGVCSRGCRILSHQPPPQAQHRPRAAGETCAQSVRYIALVSAVGSHHSERRAYVYDGSTTCCMLSPPWGIVTLFFASYFRVHAVALPPSAMIDSHVKGTST